MHNGKFDSHFSLNHGIELGNNVRDTMIAACLLNENMHNYSLSSVGKLYPDVPQKAEKLLYAHISSKFGVPATRHCMSELHRLSGDDSIAVDYAKSDTLSTLGIFHKQAEQLYGQNLDLVYDIENRLLHVLRKMERRGIHIDRARLAEVKKATEDLQMEVYQNIPLTEDCIPMNTRSNADLQEYFRMHEITEWNYTAPTTRNPNGLPSFNKTFLNSNEPGKVLVQARAIDNFINMFLNPIDNFIHEDHIHTNFNQTKGEYAYGTKTGRLSSNHPNMQQVPKRDEMLGRLFRSVFIARPGYTYVELDYSQAEPRLFSHYSGEPVLIHGYNSSPAIDMHDVAAEYMSITRKIAKNLNLGLQYAMGKAKLAASLGVDLHVATSMYQRWNKTFPKVREFTKKAAIRAEQRGFVKTILGRRARFDDSRFSYKAANRIVQGGAADILKFKMVQLDDWIEKENLSESVMMLLNIHDAVLFMIKDEIVDESDRKSVV